MKTIVLSLGGSVLLSSTATSEYIKKIGTALKKNIEHQKIYVVIGGGRVAREYINLGRTFGFNEEFLDEIGIEVTRLNAKVFAQLLTSEKSIIPKTIDEALQLPQRIIVMGGTQPGQSTDTVAAKLAEKSNADRLVIATNVDGIYTKDPKKFKDATKIKEIHINDLIKQQGTEWKAAGSNVVIDGPALKIIKQGKISTLVINGQHLDQIDNAIKGKTTNGSIILVEQ